jgi:hypothetical protein
LDGVWKFCANEPFVRDLPSLPPSSILQIICQIVRHAKQRRSPPPDRSLPRSVAKVCHTPENVIDSRGLLPRDNPLAPVLCPSVFSPTGWVTRVLSVEELYRAFNIPKAAPPVTPSDDTSWRDAPPSKVLQHAFGRWATTPNIRYIKQIQSLSDTARAPAMYTFASAQDLEASFVSAIKSNEAEIPVHLWNDRIWALGAHRGELVASFSANKGKCPLDAIREALLCYWRQRVRRSLVRYLRELHGTNWYSSPTAKEEVELGKDCISRTCAADWWEWRGGSAILFWRWAPNLKALTTQGHPSWILPGLLPNYRRPQQAERDEAMREKVKKKLAKCAGKGLHEPGNGDQPHVLFCCT